MCAEKPRALALWLLQDSAHVAQCIFTWPAVCSAATFSGSHNPTSQVCVSSSSLIVSPENRHRSASRNRCHPAVEAAWREACSTLMRPERMSNGDQGTE